MNKESKRIQPTTSLGRLQKVLGNQTESSQSAKKPKETDSAKKCTVGKSADGKRSACKPMSSKTAVRTEFNASLLTPNLSSVKRENIKNIGITSSASKINHIRQSRNIKVKTAGSANRKGCDDKKPTQGKQIQFELTAQKIAVNKININVIGCSNIKRNDK